MSRDNLALDSNVPTGRVEIADNAILSVITQAVMSCYGVVDLAPRSFSSTLSRRFRIGSTHRGIEIDNQADGLVIEISIVVEYGTPIFTVAQNVMQTVKFQVERLLGMTVSRVNVSVDGLRVSPSSEK